MSRRWFMAFAGAAAGSLLFAAEGPGEVLRGRISIQQGRPTTIGDVPVDGDEVIRAQLADERLNGFQVEARGRFTSPGHFLIDPSHTHSLLVRQDGQLKLITYFCGLCNIRAYAPGPCVCCQQETVLDLCPEP